MAPLPPRPSLWFTLSIVTLVWSVLALIGGVIALAYLGLGAIMTSSLDGVFGPEPEYLLNWAILWVALLGQLVGLAGSLVVAIMALRDRRRGVRRSGAGAVMGFIAAGVFLLVGLIQIPLVILLLEALAL